MFSAKTNLENDEVLISKALIDLYVSPDKFVLVNNVLREIIMRRKEKLWEEGNSVQYIKQKQ